MWAGGYTLKGTQNDGSAPCRSSYSGSLRKHAATGGALPSHAISYFYFWKAGRAPTRANLLGSCIKKLFSKQI